jgi:hypothetical protein
MERVPLEFGPDGGWAVLRELRGHDEEAVAGAGTADAVALLDRLLIDTPGVAFGPGSAAEMTAADRDRLLYELHQREFGDRAEGSVRCETCSEPFDLDFKLSEAVAGVQAEHGPVRTDIEREERSTFRLPDGTRFRLPTGADELAVLSLAEEQREDGLLRRCLLPGMPRPPEPHAVSEAMEAVAPLIDLPLHASCPECHREQQVHFDLQHYLLGTILQERRARLLEIHRIALAYCWSLREILDLPRRRRREFAAQIDRELPAGAPRPA